MTMIPTYVTGVPNGTEEVRIPEVLRFSLLAFLIHFICQCRVYTSPLILAEPISVSVP